MKKPLFILLLLGLFINGIAQEKPYQSGLGVYYGCSFQYHVCYDEGIMYGISNINSQLEDSTHFLNRIPMVHAIIGSEEYFTPSGFYIGPKFSAQFSYSLICARVSIISYTDAYNKTESKSFTNNDVRFTPEIGLSFRDTRTLFNLGPYVDLIHVFYGYNVPLGHDRISNVPGNRITITIDLVKDGLRK